MSEDLTEKMARALAGLAPLGETWWGGREFRQAATEILADLDLPARERALREQIAQEVEAALAEGGPYLTEGSGPIDPHDIGWVNAFKSAARIIRGGGHDGE